MFGILDLVLYFGTLTQNFLHLGRLEKSVRLQTNLQIHKLPFLSDLLSILPFIFRLGRVSSLPVHGLRGENEKLTGKL